MTNYEKILTLDKKELTSIMFKQGVCFNTGGCLAKSTCKTLNSSCPNYTCYDYFQHWLNEEYNDDIGFEDNTKSLVGLNKI